MSLPFTYI